MRRLLDPAVVLLKYGCRRTVREIAHEDEAREKGFLRWLSKTML